MFITVTFLIVSVFIPAVVADPTVEQVTINPSEPLPLSTITFNATILSNDTIDEVRLYVQECRVDLCFVHEFNISMEKIINDTFQGQCTLIEEEATQIKYRLKISSDETWYFTNITFITLAVNVKKNTTQDPAASTPGFETPLFVLSITLFIIFDFCRRKFVRKR